MMEDKERLMREYMEDSMEFAKEFDDFVENHWALSMLDAPHSLVAVIETKISRAVLSEQRRIIELISNLAYFDEEGDEMISEFKNDLIALIKGEK
jgi:hypothetical protein